LAPGVFSEQNFGSQLYPLGLTNQIALFLSNFVFKRELSKFRNFES
jgi:hypothetical protein